MEMGRQWSLYNGDLAWWDAQRLIAAHYGLRLRRRVRKPFPTQPLPKLGFDI